LARYREIEALVEDTGGAERLRVAKVSA